MNALVNPWKGAEVLRSLLEPIRCFLDDERVTEILINRPGEVFVERLGDEVMEFRNDTRLDTSWILQVSQSVASYTNQGVNEETPILSGTLPKGERFQCVLSPAAPEGGAISIRKQVIIDHSLDDYHKIGAFDDTLTSGNLEISREEEELRNVLRTSGPLEFLRAAIKNRVSLIVSGGTGSGKTTLLNALLKEIPDYERIVMIEDARELKAPTKNTVSLLTSKNEQGLAKASIQQLLEASLRMRPDRILLGELRGAEAFSFLQAINTGHPGSLSSVHANSPHSAYERLALMVMQAGIGLTKNEILSYLKEVLPIVVQMSKRSDGRRYISEIAFTKMTD